MRNHLRNIWIEQLNQNFPLNIPLYNGIGLKSEDFKPDHVFSGMVLIRDKLDAIVRTYIEDRFKSYSVEGYTFENVKVDFIVTKTAKDHYKTAVVSYDVKSNSTLIESFKLNLLSYPFVNENYVFMLNGSRFSFVDELINDYDCMFKANEDSKSISIRLSEVGNSMTLTKYFEGTCTVVLKKFNKVIDAANVKDLSETFFEKFDLMDRMHLINSHITRNRQTPTNNVEIIQYLLDNLDNEKYFKNDDIKSKKIYSGFDIMKKLLKSTVDYIFTNSSRYKTIKLRRSNYESLRSKLFSFTTLNYISDINPIAYLSSLRKIDLMGPNGPKKSNLDMRDYHSSYVGFIDPLETPESGKLGLVIHRSVGSYYDENGKLLSNGIKSDSRSFNFSGLMIPFIHNTDSVRDSMATGHIKQCKPVNNPELSNVSTGCDRVVYDLLFNKLRSPVDGEVIAVNTYSIKILGDDDLEYLVECPEVEISNDKTIINYTPRVKVGDYIQKDYILYNNSSFIDGNLCLGTNVIIAWMPYKGLNYEDSVLISESLSNRLLTTKGHDIEFDFSGKKVSDLNLPYVGQKVSKTDILCSYREIEKGVVLTELYKEAVTHKNYPANGEIIEVIVFDKSGKEVFGEVESGDISKLSIKLAAIHKIEIGDKMSFTSAAKCTLSKILPDDMMPKTKDGETIDIIHNTIGIPSRMNLSQLFEAALSNINHLIRQDILPNITTVDELINLFEIFQRIINSDNLSYFIEFIKDLDSDSFNVLLDSLKTLFIFEVKQFDNSITFDNITKLVDELNLNYDPYNGEKLYLPELEKDTKFKVYYGRIRLLVLKHVVEDKLSTTSLGNLSDIREKAQKVGEMEMLALEAHNCKHMINEITKIKANKTQNPKVLRDILSSKDELSLVSLGSYNRLSPAFSEFINVFKCYGIRMDKKLKTPKSN